MHNKTNREKLKNSKTETEDAKALEALGISKGDAYDDENATQGAFIYGGLFTIELSDKGMFYMCLDRDTYKSTGPHPTSLDEMEYLLFSFLVSGSGVVRPARIIAPRFPTSTPAHQQEARAEAPERLLQNVIFQPGPGNFPYRVYA